MMTASERSNRDQHLGEGQRVGASPSYSDKHGGRRRVAGYSSIETTIQAKPIRSVQQAPDKKKYPDLRTKRKITKEDGTNSSVPSIP
jgi:hypothetical protein